VEPVDKGEHYRNDEASAGRWREMTDHKRGEPGPRVAGPWADGIGRPATRPALNLYTSVLAGLKTRSQDRSPGWHNARWSPFCS
jgi:hypothetical protein